MKHLFEEKNNTYEKTNYNINSIFIRININE